jgi:hypothetical protein
LFNLPKALSSAINAWKLQQNTQVPIAFKRYVLALSKSKVIFSTDLELEFPQQCCIYFLLLH